MARVKRAVNAQKKRRTVLESRERLPRSALAAVPQGQGADAALDAVRLPRPPRPQGRLPPALDHPDQRRRPRQRHDVQPADPGPAASPGVEVDRKILAELAVNDATGVRRDRRGGSRRRGGRGHRRCHRTGRLSRRSASHVGPGTSGAFSRRVPPGSSPPSAAPPPRPGARPAGSSPRARRPSREALASTGLVREIFVAGRADPLRRPDARRAARTGLARSPTTAWRR